MNAYPHGNGQWIEHKGFRIEVYANGTWVVYAIDGSCRSIASADSTAARDLEGAKEAARKAYEQLRKP